MGRISIQPTVFEAISLEIDKSAEVLCEKISSATTESADLLFLGENTTDSKNTVEPIAKFLGKNPTYSDLLALFDEGKLEEIEGFDRIYVESFGVRGFHDGIPKSPQL